ncbi:MAG: hypothetical protein LBB15_01405 [Puniceicoccales bacterium]|jgi:hypothetical protein|nr:hypothetical protein [Puniceicoccales bacterium]
MFFFKKIFSFLFFVYYNLYAFSAAPPAPGLGPNVRMEVALNVPINAIGGVPFWYANLVANPPAPGALPPPVPVLPAAGVNVAPGGGPANLGAAPAQIDVDSDTVAVDKFISYCHNASLGEFDPAAAAAAAAAAVPGAAAAVVAAAAVPAVVTGLQMNALINRLREFYSTNINDFKNVITTATLNSADVRHLSLAAITVISRNTLPPAPPTYDYRSFFFARIFRSSQIQLPAGLMCARRLPNIFFHAFGQNFPGGGSLAVSNNIFHWCIRQQGHPNQAHTEGAFEEFLHTVKADPFQNQIRFNAFCAAANVLAFIVHFKNESRICEMCKGMYPTNISQHLRDLLLGPGMVAPLIYPNRTKGIYVQHAIRRKNIVLFPAEFVILPTVIPTPNVGGAMPMVRIVFIIGYGFKNVDIFE